MSLAVISSSSNLATSDFPSSKEPSNFFGVLGTAEAAEAVECPLLSASDLCCRCFFHMALSSATLVLRSFKAKLASASRSFYKNTLLENKEKLVEFFKKLLDIFGI